MNKLENKIVVYLVGQILENNRDAKRLAHDIAKIAEEDCIDKIVEKGFFLGKSTNKILDEG